MRFLRRIAELFGLGRDDDDNGNDQHRHNEEHDQQPRTTTRHFQETGLPRKGFSVPVQVAVDRSHIGPLITPCSSGDGAVQGLKWYTKRLRIDEDGDIADEFIEEVPQQSLSVTDDHQHKPTPKFVAKYSNRLAVVKKQAIDKDGKLQQCVVYEGRLQWL